jgi:hypothetical protein
MTAPLTPSERKRLAQLLGLLGSNYPGERGNAAVASHKLIQTKGVTWSEVIDPPPPEHHEPLMGTWRTTCAELLRHQGSLRPWATGF